MASLLTSVSFEAPAAAYGGFDGQLEGRDQVKLTKDDPDAGGEHHFIPLAWVDHVDSTVHLKQSGAEAKARWKTH